MVQEMLMLVMIALIAVPALAVEKTEGFEWSGGADAKILEVTNLSGEIKVTTGGDLVVIKATKVAKSDSEPEAVKGLEKVSIKVEEKPDKVEVVVDYPKVLTGLEDVRVNFDITLPEGIKLITHSVSGDISVDGVAVMEIESVNGDINISRGFEDINISVVSGDIKIDNTGKASENLNVSAVNGEIELTVSLPESGGKYSLSAVSGAIKLTIQGSTENYDINVDTISGSVDSDLPLEKTGGFVGAEYNAKAGAGDNQISISTVSGSVKIITQ